MTFLVDAPDGRTRIKLCGMTRDEDVDAAVALGVDAVGFVFWGPSPRALSIASAARLVARVPPTIDAVGLFVDASRAEVDAVLDAVPLTLLQFHGDETPADTRGFRVPSMKVARVTPALDLLAFAALHADAAALFLDAHTAAYGGAGKVFDWSLIPPLLVDTVRRFAAPDAESARQAAPNAARGAPRVVLSGGLSARNVADAIERVRPYAVDTSSGIEVAKGIKDAGRMRDFVAAVRQADPPSS